MALVPVLMCGVIVSATGTPEAAKGAVGTAIADDVSGTVTNIAAGNAIGNHATVRGDHNRLVAPKGLEDAETTDRKPARKTKEDSDSGDADS